MYRELFEYLILHKELVLPGIGEFAVERIPARKDFSSKLIYPPSEEINFRQTEKSPTNKFFHWLSEKWRISYQDAIYKFEEFLSGLKSQLRSGAKVDWPELGSLSLDLSGQAKFAPVQSANLPELPVAAVKVIREKAEHNVRVGEMEKTSGEMSEWLDRSKGRKFAWWIPALILLVILLAVATWYFATSSDRDVPAANQKKLEPAPEPVNHRMLPAQ